VERVLFAPRELPPLRPNVSDDGRLYDEWVRAREAERCETLDLPPTGRSLRVVMVVDGRPLPETSATLQSLRAQKRGGVKLTIVLLSLWRHEMSALLKTSDMPFPSHLVLLDDGSTSSQLLQRALEETDSDGVALIYPGDVWAPDAVLQLSAALEHHGVVYADEDCVDGGGVYCHPRLKPDFSPEFLLHADCIGRPLALSAEVVAGLPESSARSLGARDHDLALRACETAHSVRHVAEVLCHRHIESLSSSIEAEDDWGHVQSAIARRQERASAQQGAAAGTLRIIRTPEVRSASVIIPFRDEPRFLRACFDSIERTRKDVAVEYLLVDNGSDQPETATLLERLGDHPDVSILRDDKPFNWAKLNNAAAARASRDVLAFLNNDIEALSHGWLDALCAQVERPEIGAAGARLLYPDHRVQHCGVVLGLGGAAGHLFVGLAEEDPGYLNMAVTTRECSAVTGACLATRRSLFEELGGFDETLGVDLNDIDYCLRVWGSGRRVVYESTAELLHYESPSRGTAGAVGDIIRFVDRWKGSILAGDAYLNRHLTRVDSSCALRDPGEEMWWQQWYAGLSQMTHDGH
jgi:GT2 family glycosyltransferase